MHASPTREVNITADRAAARARRIAEAMIAEEAGRAAVVFPGETLEMSVWEQPGSLLISARGVERDTSVLSNAAMKLR